MCVVNHGYGGLGAAGLEVVDVMHAGQMRFVASREMPSIYGVRGDTLMTPDHTATYVSRLGEDRNFSVFQKIP